MRSPNWLFLVLLLLLAGLQYRLWVGNGSFAQVKDLTQQIADQHAETNACWSAIAFSMPRCLS